MRWHSWAACGRQAGLAGLWGTPGTSSSALVLAGRQGGRASVEVRVPGLAAGWPEAAGAWAKGLGPAPMGRRPVGTDKRVVGGQDQQGSSLPLRPSHIIAACKSVPSGKHPPTLSKAEMAIPTMGLDAHCRTTIYGVQPAGPAPGQEVPGHGLT